MKNKIKEKIKHRINVLNEKGILRKLSDKRYIKLYYWMNLDKRLNLKHPKAFNEKLQWLKLYDRNPNYIKMVDKYEVKKYVSSIIGDEYIIPTIGIYNSFDEIDFDKLPKSFVIKCTHDSGGLIICKDKKKFNKEDAKVKIEKSLKNNYFWHGREWPYKNVSPRIIIEKYMEDKKTKELRDYKFMCFNGEVKCSFVCSNRNKEEGLCVDFFDIDWNRLPFKRHYQNSKQPISKPKNYNKMIKIAEKLSKDIPFVRIDLYEINNKIYFGEITFFPGNGYEEFEPVEWDYILGEYIKLPNKKYK